MRFYFEFPQMGHFAGRLKSHSTPGLGTLRRNILHFPKYSELSIAHCTSTYLIFLDYSIVNYLVKNKKKRNYLLTYTSKYSTVPLTLTTVRILFPLLMSSILQTYLLNHCILSVAVLTLPADSCMTQVSLICNTSIIQLYYNY